MVFFPQSTSKVLVFLDLLQAELLIYGLLIQQDPQGLKVRKVHQVSLDSQDRLVLREVRV